MSAGTPDAAWEPTTPGPGDDQPQRTLLAWRRTALAAGAVAALVVHHAASRGWGPLVVPAALSICLAILAVSMTGLRSRQLRLGRTDLNSGYVGALAVGVAATTVFTGVAELVIR